MSELICIRCEEIILPHEVMPDFKECREHWECMMRSIAGSVAHQQGRCSCYGGMGEDDENLSARENARAAARYYLDTQDKLAKARFN